MQIRYYQCIACLIRGHVGIGKIHVRLVFMCAFVTNRPFVFAGCAFVTFASRQYAIAAIKGMHQAQTMEVRAEGRWLGDTLA